MSYFITTQDNPANITVDSNPFSTKDIANHTQSIGDSFSPEFEPPKIELERCCRHCGCDWGRLWLDFKIYCSYCDKPLRWADPEIWLLRSDLHSREFVREGALR